MLCYAMLCYAMLAILYCTALYYTMFYPWRAYSPVLYWNSLGEEAWVLTDAKTKTGKCVRFDADKSCGAQCYHQGQPADESVPGAVCTKICRVAGAAGAQCNVIKMVTPTDDQSEELGEGQTMYLTKSKVMQAGLKKGDLGEADPMACAGVANNRQQ